MNRNSLKSTIFSVFLLVVAAIAILNRQYIYDQMQVYAYTPSSEIQSIVNKSALSETGKFYLFASHASIDSASEFNANCQRQEVGNAILGCYSNRNIYIYDVNNSTLEGIKEVTAVHEMLHATWDRLSESDIERISVMLEAAYELNKTPELVDRMSYYSRNEAGQRSNELHSIVGTEMKNIGSDLEEYYSKYFTDRSKVISLFEKYNSIFEELSNKSDSLYSELKDLSDRVSILSTEYEINVAKLSNDIKKYNEDAESGNFNSISELNSRRNELINRSNAIESDRVTINNMIDEYQTKYKQYQELIIQNQSLNNSIDSHVEPAPSL